MVVGCSVVAGISVVVGVFVVVGCLWLGLGLVLTYEFCSNLRIKM